MITLSDLQMLTCDTVIGVKLLCLHVRFSILFSFSDSHFGGNIINIVRVFDLRRAFQA